MALFEIKNLTFTYPGQQQPALLHLDFTVENGEFLVICGKIRLRKIYAAETL